MHRVTLTCLMSGNLVELTLEPPTWGQSQGPDTSTCARLGKENIVVRPFGYFTSASSQTHVKMSKLKVEKQRKSSTWSVLFLALVLISRNVARSN